MTTRTMIATVGALLTLAGSAQADVVQSLGLGVTGTPIAQAVAPGEGIKVASLADLRHINPQGNGFNKVIELDVGAGAYSVAGLGWDLSSWAWTMGQTSAALSDMKFAIVNSAGDGVTFTPYAGNGAAGAGATSGYVDLAAMGFDFDISDGKIYIELFSENNVFAANNDFQGQEGSHTPDSIIEVDVVPAPGSLALMGLGGLAVARRRRR